MTLRRSLPMYSELLDSQIKFIVDKSHFRGHSEDDEWCQKNCSPNHYETVLEDQNSQACEQTNRWAMRSLLRALSRCASKLTTPILCLELQSWPLPNGLPLVQVVWPIPRDHAADDAEQIQVLRIPHVRATQQVHSTLAFHDVLKAPQLYPLISFPS
eukprot:5765992-Prymnesium_polylepis.1